jgi:hypothetical protein
MLRHFPVISPDRVLTVPSDGAFSQHINFNSVDLPGMDKTSARAMVRNIKERLEDI